MRLVVWAKHGIGFLSRVLVRAAEEFDSCYFLLADKRVLHNDHDNGEPTCSYKRKTHPVFDCADKPARQPVRLCNEQPSLVCVVYFSRHGTGPKRL